MASVFVALQEPTITNWVCYGRVLISSFTGPASEGNGDGGNEMTHMRSTHNQGPGRLNLLASQSPPGAGTATQPIVGPFLLPV